MLVEVSRNVRDRATGTECRHQERSVTRFLMIETGQAISAAHSQDLSPTVCVCVLFF